MNFLVIIAGIEIIAIEFNVKFSFKILSETNARIILNISYAILTSWIFFILNIIIPRSIEQKQRAPILNQKLFYLINNTNSVFECISKNIHFNKEYTKEEILNILNLSDDELDVVYCELYRKNALKFINQIYKFASFVDAKVLNLVNEIDLYLSSCNFTIEIEGLTLIQAHKEYILELWGRLTELKKIIRKDYNMIAKKVGITTL